LRVEVFVRAVIFDGRLRFLKEFPEPEIPSGWALIRVLKAGICKTDIEITRGYKNFKGVLGHEFIGVVEQCHDPDWLQKKVVGEINVGCGECEQCADELERHCPQRRVLGIVDLNGCMADYCVLPLSNLHAVPASMADHRAVLVEPLSAACEILEQLELKGSEQAVVLGDGRLGILCAWVLSTVLSDVTLIGRHPEKLEKGEWHTLKTARISADRRPGADIVVEATGSGKGLVDAMFLCRPRGKILLKSTVVSKSKMNLSSMVVNEQTLIGSRCGRFEMGLRIMESYPDMPLERLISADYPIEQALEAFEQAIQPDTLKIVLDMTI
jgi:alcohol dehydrogenase